MSRLYPYQFQQNRTLGGSDFPDSFTGAEFQFLTVNDLEDAVEFTEFSVDFLKKTQSYAMAIDDSVILADATKEAITITLPLPQSTKRRVVFIKKIDASNNVVTVAVA